MGAASMGAVPAVLLIPIGSAASLAILPGYRLTARLNVVVSLATFLSALSLFVVERPQPMPYVLVDDLNIVFIVLNTFVGFTTSIFSASYIAHELDTGRLTPVYLRFYHAMYQTMMFGMNLAFVSNNIGLMWVAVEIATLTTVLMVGIYRTHAALEAAWKYFILGSVGIAMAIAPGPLMVTMGLVSVVFAAFMLYRRRDIKRLFAYSSIEHMGIIVFAFGMGGPLANFAGLLHMVMHSLTKSAIFYAVGHVSQIKGTQRISRIRGLTVTHPALGWGLVV